MKVFVSTAPFGARNQLPVELLQSAKLSTTLNPLGRRLTEAELVEHARESEILIAGTEQISSSVMDSIPHLKLIARVGIGTDGVDLNAARERNILVTYTPEAPAPAVAELTIGLLVSLLRGVHTTNLSMHERRWERHQGKRIAESTIGVIGAGRIGSRVIRRLSAFGSPRVLVNDLEVKSDITSELKLEWVDKETVLSESDVVTLHVPLTSLTREMISAHQLDLMRQGAYLINTSRGGIVDEDAVGDALRSGHLAGAAIDVFENEPYSGALCDEPNALLTCHMGSMSEDCRARMELEAAEEAVRFARGLDPLRPVPDVEYDIQASS